ncbi:MAG: hypothetical protein LBS65_09840 [Desulfovibrio sp.]|jgi:hypothetical protein|nr:hypothetical protein [Desulfovibrio sp.]
MPDFLRNGQTLISQKIAGDVEDAAKSRRITAENKQCYLLTPLQILFKHFFLPGLRPVKPRKT